MKHKIIEMILKMDLRSIETQLVLQCAPFLAGLKVSNLLAIPADMENAAMDMLKKAGISFFRMIKTDKKTVILLFHRKQLESYLYKEDVKEILSNYQKMINEEEYNKEILEELNVYDTICKQPNRKNCALLPSVAVSKMLGELGK